MSYFAKTSFFILGIKGAAMANIARILTQMGKIVAGVDVAEEFITDVTLKQAGVKVITDFSDHSLIDGADVVVYSAAHGGMSNELVQYALKKGKKVVHQTDLIAEFMAVFPRSVAVAGCHGKTTTSSLLAHTLLQMGADPSYCIGVPSFAGKDGGAYRSSDWCVVEADEYGMNPPSDRTPKLLRLHPTCSVITNIDFDHPDVYADIEHTTRVFLEFMTQTKEVIVGCSDDDRVWQCMQRLTGKKCIGYGFSERAGLRITSYMPSPTGTILQCLYNGKVLGPVQTELYGEHNARNTAAVIATLLSYGYAFSEIQKAFKGFTGAKRRMEVVWSSTEAVIVDDYAHHPSEIAATIASCRQRFPESFLVVVFQPHTFSRTQALIAEFARSLSSADRTFVLPIFASARENSADFQVSSGDIADQAGKMGHPTVVPVLDAAGLREEIRALNREKKAAKTVYVTLGAGDVYHLKNDIIEAIGTRTV